MRYAICKKFLLTFAILSLIMIYGCSGGDEDKNKNQQVKDSTSSELNDSRRSGIDRQNLDERNFTNQPKNIAPKIFITEPDPNEVIKTDSIEIEWVASDRNNDALLIELEYQREGSGGWIRISDFQENDGNFLWNARNISNGNLNIRATATDGSLSGEDTSGIFTLDR